MDTLTLTYEEIAERLGIALHSARNLVRRKRWARTVGNDGKARIAVPEDALRGTVEGAAKGTVEASLKAAPEAGEEAPSMSHALMVARLEAQVEGLKQIVEAERRRADSAEADRDRWHALANRPWWKRLAG